MGAVICYLLSTVSWMEGRRTGKQENLIHLSQIETDVDGPHCQTTKIIDNWISLVG